MNITFKDVNQGDGILVTWGNPLKYGIIDCCRENGNPILEQVKASGCRQIEFIILSHPHTDHYSGFADLLAYLRTANISVKVLGMTFDSVIIPALAKFYSTNSKTILYRFFESIFEDKDSHSPIIGKWLRVDMDTADQDLGDGYTMNFRSPSISEIADVLRTYAKIIAGKVKGVPDFNVFSSVIELRNDGKSVLFTSDAPKVYFEKLERYYARTSHHFVLMQAPHHGSRANHLKTFWENVVRSEKCPMIFSVGEDKHDKLPNSEVVADMLELGYDIHSTNEVYGIKEVLSKIKHSKHLPSIFDFVSTSTGIATPQSSKYNGDQTFAF